MVLPRSYNPFDCKNISTTEKEAKKTLTIKRTKGDKEERYLKFLDFVREVDQEDTSSERNPISQLAKLGIRTMEMDGHYQGCCRLRGQIPGTPEIPGRTAPNVSGRGGGSVFQIHRSLTLNREIKGSLLNPGLPIRFVGLLCQVGHSLCLFLLEGCVFALQGKCAYVWLFTWSLLGAEETSFSGQDGALCSFFFVVDIIHIIFYSCYEAHDKSFFLKHWKYL
ncbi:hypothetical protein NPIL_502901 [Nephila pilipes]|uniref:Uncharacterized protein n=1 Tax=Nephila pilipes TaxID=299642 RepID=A0A8X6Q600_NEPPI|nr:hypothetical protein NPIL_502901 [Nephila pilipes]